MKKLSLLVVFWSLSLGPAFAADPTGDWRVEDGSAHIRIAICGGTLWGVIGWEQNPGGTDAENPDPAKRSRPTLGMPILIDMKPVDGKKWSGQIYNAKNGKMYDASVTPLSATSLRVQGCVLGGLFCGGETWLRVTPPAPGSIGATTGSGLSGQAGNICSRLGLATRTTH